MARLAISLFGCFRATRDGVPLTGFVSDKGRALLAYLAVEADRPHRRAALATLLWPDRPGSAALANLRQTLHRLRGMLGDPNNSPPFLLVNSREVQFNRQSGFWLDVAEFSFALAERHRHHTENQLLCEGCLTRLHAATDLYKGDMLAGFTLPGCPEFEWWLLSRQEAYHHQAIEVLDNLILHHERSQDFPLFVHYAQRAIELEPWRERAHRQKMRALALDGQRRAALRQYEICRQILAEEMGVEPAPETTRLFRQISAQAGTALGKRPGGSMPAPPDVHPAAGQTTMSFVAREAELSRLGVGLEAALSGKGQPLFITGDAGSGKTALLDEFTRRAVLAHADLLVGRGRCSGFSGHGDPYQPFREALGSLASAADGTPTGARARSEPAGPLLASFPMVPDSLLEAGPDLVDSLVSGEALARLARDLEFNVGASLAHLESLRAGRTGDLSGDGSGTSPAAGLSLGPAAITPPPDQALSNLLEQVSGFLLALSRQYPVLLLLDDLQWADCGSLAMLFHLARSLPDARILLLGAYRPEGLPLQGAGERHPLISAVCELERHYGDFRVDLGKVDGRAFVNACLDGEPNRLDQAFREALYRRTGGHALFTVELLSAMRKRGELEQDAGGCWVRRTDVDWTILPVRVRAVIAERLGRLDGECRAILDAACVQGETFAAEPLAEALRVCTNRVIERLNATICKQHRLATAVGLQHSGAQRLARYRFNNALFQEYLYQDLNAVERRRLQQATAEALDKLSVSP